jgi:hypothetical protein
MLLLAFILCYALGLSVMFTISRKYSLAELIGYSFLIGIGLETVGLFLLDVVHIQYSQGLILGLNLLCIAAICAANYKNLLQAKNEFHFPSFTLRDINPAALLIFCAGAYLLYAVTVKNLFWPTGEHDSIGTFDKLGKVMAIEGRLKVSLFQYHLEGAGGIYPPLFHASLAYAYIFGALTAKIITTLFFVSLISSFYGLLRNYLDSTASMLFTFLLMITPELFSHAALSLDNMPTTAYVGPGALATFLWLDRRDRKYFWIGATLIAFAIWIRSDTIVFTAAALLITGIDFLRTKDWKSTLIYAGIIVAPFIIWTLYLKLKINQAQEARFDLGIGYNTERVNLMTGYLKAFLLGNEYSRIDGGQLYGLSFVLFFLMIIVNLALMFKVGVKKIVNDKLYVLIFFFAALTAYSAIFYLLSEKTQGSPLYSLMESSFKRGLFCFVPIALFYAATNYASVWAFDKLEKFRNPQTVN